MLINDINDVLPIIAYLGGLVAVWIKFSNRVIHLESKIEVLERDLQEMKSNYVNLAVDIRKILEALATLHTDIAYIKTQLK